MKQKKYIAGLYFRLSQEDERQGESASIDNQRMMLRKYAEEHGFEIHDEYIDDGISGTTFQRPGVQRLLDDAKTGVINTIIVKDLSRFGRNYIEVGQYIDYVFPAFGIRFIAIQDNVDTENRDSGSMEMMPIMNVFNEWHAANTSKKIRAVRRANAKEGIYTAKKASYGYKMGTDKKRTPVIDEETAPIVRRISHTLFLCLNISFSYVHKIMLHRHSAVDIFVNDIQIVSRRKFIANSKLTFYRLLGLSVARITSINYTIFHSN